MTMKHALLLIALLAVLWTAGAMHWEYLHRNDKMIVTVYR